MTREVLDQLLQQTLPHGRVKASRPAGCRDVALYLFDPAVLQGPLSHEEAQAVVDEPAYWSFCWASGQVLASYLLSNPELVAGRRVLDFGCGSGIVAIAAAMAGASEVIACDSDPAALQATRANAALNGVSLGFCDSWEHRPSRLDLILAADVLYDAENLPLLDAFCVAAKGVLLADSRIRNLGDARYCLQSTVEGRTWPDLNEFEEFNRVRIYKA
ncbi:class I SAM-dependent methyltransferase [Marinobacter salicampi]|uniref:class I SAM-dependent methyltransferase n=1 Tax=Marinobacter salicampi TaxID=435907 RepID=UPI00140CA7D0|nr:50S ribosomal protein L11 methyltransferase [Marinobacter salicampi]